MIGTQTKEETKEVLESLIQNKQNGEKENIGSKHTEKTETLNVLSAMKELHRIKAEMGNSGLLTVQLVCDVHRVLMKSLHKDAGELRETVVYTRHKGTIHVYPEPTHAKILLDGIINRHNIFVEGSPKDKQSIEYVTHVFKYAARLLFDFVDTHPFSDGNGRMCRLLANYSISHITPFPVGIYHSKNPEKNTREDYINVIVKYRENPKDGPRELAIMLIEDAVWTWKVLFDDLEEKKNGQFEDYSSKVSPEK